ncbi:MAG TPA: MAPEG family protein [Hyphomonadaceae bacterium]|nr:MAPEG family protein [Hyphomonadaceae bacterium]
MYAHGLILPVLVLVAWSILVWLWMIAGRVSVMRREKIHPQKAVRTREFATPGSEQWVADNYNHLMEQPTIFYAAALATHAGGQGDAINVGLAWTYVAVRMVHTMVQTTANIVMWRFYLFVLSTLALAVLVIRAMFGLFLV